jgi:hypothetical protein
LLCFRQRSWLLAISSVTRSASWSVRCYCWHSRSPI